MRVFQPGHPLEAPSLDPLVPAVADDPSPHGPGAAGLADGSRLTDREAEGLLPGALFGGGAGRAVGAARPVGGAAFEGSPRPEGVAAPGAPDVW
jgi:hypothetical protein